MYEKQDVLFDISDPLPLEGKVSGYVKMTYSSDRSAYGFVPVPIVVVGSGTGPTVLLLAGVFGDEVEGQVAAARVARALDPTKMQGRVIVLPMANQPAAIAGTRNSPIDAGNLNRSFPGDLLGSPTAQIAHYIERYLMPQCDAVIDIHTRGDSFSYLPCATLVNHADPDERAKRLALALAFGAPNLIVFHSYEERMSSGASKRAGAVRMGVEISGDGCVQSVFDGIMAVLDWGGVCSYAERPAAGPVARSDVRLVHAETDYVYALANGIFEPLAWLGDRVEAGALAGCIHDPSDPLAAPKEVRFHSAGKVVCTRGASRARRGDCLVHVSSEPGDQWQAEIASAADFHWLRDLYRRRSTKSISNPSQTG